MCQLCLLEKTFIATADPRKALNKRNEIISKCRHWDKTLLKNWWFFSPHDSQTNSSRIKSRILAPPPHESFNPIISSTISFIQSICNLYMYNLLMSAKAWNTVSKFQINFKCNSSCFLWRCTLYIHIFCRASKLAELWRTYMYVQWRIQGEGGGQPAPPLSFRHLLSIFCTPLSI